MEENKVKSIQKEEGNNNKNSNSSAIAIIIFIIIVFIAIKMFTGWWNSLGDNSSKNNSNIPDKIELMTYAQEVLKDNLSNPKYSSYKEDYNFIQTGLRYKIEGNVTVNGNKEKFYMIIQFTNDTYKKYDLISLQVGNKKVY